MTDVSRPAAPSPAARALVHAATALVANGWQDSEPWREDFALLARVLPLVEARGAHGNLRIACAELVAAKGQDMAVWRRASDGLRFAVERYHRAAMVHFHAQVAGVGHAG